MTFPNKGTQKCATQKQKTRALKTGTCNSIRKTDVPVMTSDTIQ